MFGTLILLIFAFLLWYIIIKAISEKRKYKSLLRDKSDEELKTMHHDLLEKIKGSEKRLSYIITNDEKYYKIKNEILDFRTNSNLIEKEMTARGINIENYESDINSYSESLKYYKKKVKSNKPASATKRAVAGAVLGGTTGAVIGAASAIDKNNKK